MSRPGLTTLATVFDTSLFVSGTVNSSDLPPCKDIVRLGRDADVRRSGTPRSTCSSARRGRVGLEVVGEDDGGVGGDPGIEWIPRRDPVVSVRERSGAQHRDQRRPSTESETAVRAIMFTFPKVTTEVTDPFGRDGAGVTPCGKCRAAQPEPQWHFRCSLGHRILLNRIP